MEQEFQFEQINEKELQTIYVKLEAFRAMHPNLWTAKDEAAFHHLHFIWWAVNTDADVALYEIEKIDESDMPF